MTPQFPPHEVLLFIDTSFTTTQSFESKNRDYCHVSRDVSTHAVCWSGLLLQLLSLLPKHPCKAGSELPWEIIRARHFVEVKFGDVNNPIEYSTSVNPYLFSLTTNLS